jgi:L-lactate dehydrogenase complex protein LldE
MIVDLHIPCYVDRYFPSTAMNMAEVLKRYGCAVNVPAGQTCCGMPALFDGFSEPCKEAGEYMIPLFQNDRPIVSCGTVCASVMKCHYHDLFHNSALHNEYKHVQQNLFEFSTFLVEKLHVEETGKTWNARAVFIGGCAGVNGCISHQPAIRLLNSIKNLELISIPGNSCCGWGGTMARNDEKKAVEMALALLHQIQSTGAELIISNEPGCLMHLMMVMKKHSLGIKTLHMADVLV